MYCARCGTWTPDSEPACARCGEPRPAAAASGPVGPEAAAPPTTTPATVTAPAIALRYGGFWRRLAASLVDGVLLFFPDAIVRVGLGLPTVFNVRPVRDDEMGALFTAVSIAAAMGWIYCAGLESSGAQGTLGQRLLDLRVTDAAARRVSFGRATARHFAQILSLLLCGIGYLFNLWTSHRQTLHDLVAGCMLVRPAVTVAAPAPSVSPAS